MGAQVCGRHQCRVFSTEIGLWLPLVGGIGTTFQITSKYLLKVTREYIMLLSGILQYHPHFYFLFHNRKHGRLFPAGLITAI